MRKDIVVLSQKEQQRLRVVTEVEAGRLEPDQAAQLLGLSLRQLRRLRQGIRQEGAAAFMHGNRGRTPTHRLSDQTRATIAELSRTKYAGCNDTHLAELLVLREGILVSRRSVARLLRQAGIKPMQRRRAPKHRSRRDRMTQEGMLLQVDGSPFNWLGPGQRRYTLLGAIDDATGKVVAALFREQEDAHGYFLLLRQVLTGHGIPLDLYHDRHPVFQENSKRSWTVEEEMAGRKEPTQFGRALQELGIGSIVAHSPQAKGRIERLWRTFQDRLVAEMRLENVTDMKAADRFLAGFLKRYNGRFAVAAAEPGLAYRALTPEIDLDEVLSFRYQRVVARDNTVHLQERLVQVPPGPKHRSFAGCRVWVHELLDGSLGIRYQDRWIARTAASIDPPVLRARQISGYERQNFSKAIIPRPEHPGRITKGAHSRAKASSRTESLPS